MTETHLVVGAGATGTATTKLLAQSGASVTVVTRSGSGPDMAGVTRLATDAADADQLASIAAGATAIYNCANPPYHRWQSDWPPLADSLLVAAERSGAVLVTLSNLYGYPNPSKPMRATDELNPSSRKGAVRAAMWQDALAAHDAGRLRMTEARASDFIGPGLGDNGHMGDRVIPRLLAGKSVSLLGDLDQPHSWSAVDDVARTLVALGTDERAWGRAWHVPTVAPLSQRELVLRMCELANVSPVKIKAMPKLALRAAGLFVPAVRELGEVSYQFDAPFVIDSSETTDVFDLSPTALDVTLRATLASYGAGNGSDLQFQR